MTFSTVWFRRENKRDRKWGGKFSLQAHFFLSSQFERKMGRKKCRMMYFTQIPSLYSSHIPLTLFILFNECKFKIEFLLQSNIKVCLVGVKISRMENRERKRWQKITFSTVQFRRENKRDRKWRGKFSLQTYIFLSSQFERKMGSKKY